MSNKKVVVLLDNEKIEPDYISRSYLGKDKSIGMLCRLPTPAELANQTYFTYEIFGLLVSDKKLDDYIQRMDGIIIIINCKNINTNVLSRIDTIIKQNPYKLLMCILEKYENYNFNPSKYFTSFTTNYRKYFFIDYDVNFKSTMDSSVNWFNGMIKNNNQKDQEKKEKIESSVDIPLEKYVKMFVDNTLPMHLWDHFGRLRIVHFSLMKFGYHDTIDPESWLCTHWKKYKSSIGHGNLWHYTLTIFWASILYILQSRKKYKSFDDLYNDNPNIQSGKLFKEYYSDDVLFNDNARNNWVKPNLKNITDI